MNSRMVVLSTLVVRTLVAMFGLLAGFGSALTTEANAADSQRNKLVAERIDLYAGFFKQLDDQILRAEAKQLDDAVKELKSWQVPVDGQKLLGRRLPRLLLAEVSLDLPPVERDWQVELRAARRKHANALYLLARRIVNADLPSFAWAVLHEALHFDSDHKSARALLGYVQAGEEWMTPFAAKMAKKNMVWHSEYGWLPDAHVKRYERGERFFQNNWITAEKEAAHRVDFRYAWQIETEHYRVQTNVSLERGVELARLLEGFYEDFHNRFAAFFNSPEQLKKLFKDSSAQTAKISKPLEVYFYRTKDEYVAKLKKKNPQIEITNGIYMPDDRIAYFFQNSQIEVESTLYHEATHQLLYELSGPRSATVREHPWDREHFWIVEGFACYMESFRQAPEGNSIGDPKYIRFEAAEIRRLQENYYMPLSRFTSLGMVAFQLDEHIEKNYSQAAGLSHFFLHYDNGRYRDALIRHLQLLYQPGNSRLRVAGLDQLTETSYERLDEQYKEHLESFSKDTH